MNTKRHSTEAVFALDHGPDTDLDAQIENEKMQSRRIRNPGEYSEVLNKYGIEFGLVSKDQAFKTRMHIDYFQNDKLVDKLVQAVRAKSMPSFQAGPETPAEDQDTANFDDAEEIPRRKKPATISCSPKYSRLSRHLAQNRYVITRPRNNLAHNKHNRPKLQRIKDRTYHESYGFSEPNRVGRVLREWFELKNPPVSMKRLN